MALNRKIERNLAIIAQILEKKSSERTLTVIVRGGTMNLS